MSGHFDCEVHQIVRLPQQKLLAFLFILVEIGSAGQVMLLCGSLQLCLYREDGPMGRITFLRRALTAGLFAAAMVITSVIVPTATASATIDDGFTAFTGLSPNSPNTCWDTPWYGRSDYVDHGPSIGYDEFRVYDTCPDGVGVRAWIWVNGVLIGSARNDTGYNTYVWAKINPQIQPGQVVGIKVCAQNGPNGTPFSCGEAQRRSDG